MTGGRAFWALVAISAAIRAAVIFLACCLTMSLAWQIAHHGAGALRSGTAWAGATLLALSAAGTAQAAWRLWCGLRATLAVSREVRATAVDESEARVAARKAGLAARVDVVEAADPFAFTYGLTRPRVAVSGGLLASATTEELSAVLAHEAEHVRGRDPLRMLISGLLAAQHFTLPLLGHLRTAFAEGRELAADRCAVARCGTGPVAGALLKVSDAPRAVCAASAAAMGNRHLLMARISQLESGESPRPARPSRRQMVATAAGATVYAWAIAGSSWLIAATPLACLGKAQ